MAMIELTHLHTLSPEARHECLLDTISGLQSGEKFKAIVPYYMSIKSTLCVPPAFSEISFNDYLDQCDIVMAHAFQDDSFSNRSDEAKNYAIKHYFNVISDLVVEFTKK